MAYGDRTYDFREAVKEHGLAASDVKRRRVSRPSKGDTRDGSVLLGKEYVAEAYVILNHINTLTRTLANIRKPYLNVDSRSSPLVRQGSASRTFSLSGSESWAGLRHLTNEERDQIDMQARVILIRCADRIKEMETLEKKRKELVASKSNPLTRFLPARLMQDESTLSSDVVAAHHSSITWYLSRRLTEASQSQKEMQEERVKRQLERSRSLGSNAAREVLNVGSSKAPSPEQTGGSRGGGWLGEASSSIIAATIGSPYPGASPRLSTSTFGSLDIPTPSDDEDEDLELSASQILQFETENANILRNVQDTLASVQQAESRLLDISALQMELVTHLTRQTELTDQLYEDAIATTTTVEKGNIQLREAKRRAKDSRLFILLFFIGASLSLLFLHYY